MSAEEVVEQLRTGETLDTLVYQQLLENWSDSSVEWLVKFFGLLPKDPNYKTPPRELLVKLRDAHAYQCLVLLFEHAPDISSVEVLLEDTAVDWMPVLGAFKPLELVLVAVDSDNMLTLASIANTDVKAADMAIILASTYKRKLDYDTVFSLASLEARDAAKTQEKLNNSFSQNKLAEIADRTFILS